MTIKNIENKLCTETIPVYTSYSFNKIIVVEIIDNLTIVSRFNGNKKYRE